MELIRQLNTKLSGWANCYRHVVAKQTFSYVDHQVYLALSAWIKRRHPNKSAQWRYQRYFRAEGHRRWVFSAKRDAPGKHTYLDLFRVASMPIVRHIKTRASATPYDPAFTDYFIRRAQARPVSRRAWRGMQARV